MQNRTPISNSSDFHYIDRFNDILKIATAMKAQCFYADADRNKLYGFFEEGYSLLETQLPFKITSSVFFAAYYIDKNIAAKYDTFFYWDNMPCVLFPENRRAELTNAKIFEMNDNTFMELLLHNMLGECIILFDPANWFLIPKYINLITSYYLRGSTLSQPIVFEKMQNNETIAFVKSSKVSMGSTLLTLNGSGKTYSMYIFKSLLGPLTSTDDLSIIIRPDIIECNKFMATFRVHKKKIKLDIPELTSMIVDTHVFILNLS